MASFSTRLFTGLLLQGIVTAGVQGHPTQTTEENQNNSWSTAAICSSWVGTIIMITSLLEAKELYPTEHFENHEKFILYIVAKSSVSAAFFYLAVSLATP